MASQLDLTTLKSELAKSRESIAANFSALRRDFDVGAKLKRGVKNSPLPWYVGAGIIGLLLARLPHARRETVDREPKKFPETSQQAGFAAVAITVLKLVADFARPALIRWLKDRYLNPTRASQSRRSAAF